MANYSYRKSNNETLVLLGETNEYEPLSRAAFFKAMLKEKVKQIDVDVEEVVNSKKDANA